MKKSLKSLFAGTSLLFSLTALAFGAEPKKIVFVSHLSSHGRGEHEYTAGSRMLGKWLKDAYGDDVVWEQYVNWPEDPERAFDGAASVVIFCSGGGGHLVNPHVKEFDEVMRRGVGLACLHYAVEVPIGPAAKGMLNWMGGYFETDWSVNPHWKPKFETFAKHPVSQGLAPFEIDDEWYFHMRFTGDESRITPILTAVAPKETMNRADGPHSGNPAVRKAVEDGISQHVAWTYQRGEDYNNGRGFGFTGLHYHKNLENDSFRKTVLNGIAWTAGLEVPEGGIVSSTPSEEALEQAVIDAIGPKEAKKTDARPATRQPGNAANTLKPVFQSKVVTEETPGHVVPVEADITGAKELFSVVSDGGDGFSFDWANWLEPRLVGKAGELKLTSLKWKRASSGWGTVAVNRNAGGGDLMVRGTRVADGLGTHANSVIVYDLPEGYAKFTAKGAIDDGGADQGGGSSLQFLVYTQDPGLVVSAPSTGGGNADSRSPENAVASLDVHPDLEATLFASEPLMLSPSTIDVDHRGRVWVGDVVNYRGHQGERPEGDRLLILEDSDGDGAADRSTTFYQGNDIDSLHGVCVLGNRVIVSAGNEVFWLIDDDGDDKSDRKEILFTNIDGKQHDHGIHAFMFGPDGRLYFNAGNAAQRLCDKDGNVIVDLAGNRIERNRKPYQEGMVYRCELDGSKVESLGWNFRNNWEVCVDSFGTLWQSDNDDDGNRGVRINFVMEFGNYGYRDEINGAGWRDDRIGIEKEIPLMHWHLNDPGVVPNLLQTGAGSPTGITIYDGTLLPEIFRQQVIHCDAGPNVCRAYITNPSGAGYEAEMVNLLSSTRDRWYRPSDVCVAPDGSLMISDWYDPGVGGHGMGDTQRGRLFRLAPKGTAYGVPKSDFDSLEGALAALKSPNNATRYLGWQGLKKLGAPALVAVKQLAVDTQAPAHLRARALFFLGQSDPSAIEMALKNADPRLRIVGLRLARQLGGDVLGVVKRLVNDPDAQVRRECAVALRFDASSEANQLWAQLARRHDGKDRWYLEALGIGADLHWDARLGAYLANSPSGPGTDDILWRSRAERTAGFLAERLLAGGLDEAAQNRYLRAFHFLPAGATRDAALVRLFEGGAPEVQLAAASYLEPSVITGSPERLEKAKGVLEKLRGTPEFVQMASRLNVGDFYLDLLEFVASNPDANERFAAVRLMLKQPVRLWADLQSASPTVQARLAAALGGVGDDGAVAVLAREMAKSANPLEQRRGYVKALGMSGRGEKWLFESAKQGAIADDLRLAVGSTLGRSRDREIRDSIKSVLNLPAAVGAENLPPIAQLVRMRGNAANGPAVFAKATCNTCHRVNNEGIDFGPDLSDIGNKLSAEGLFEAILYPNNAISHGFHGVSITTSAGDEYGGYVLSETNDEIGLRMPGGITTTLSKSAIAKRTEIEQSLMPPGLAALLTAGEFADLVSYLQSLKK